MINKTRKAEILKDDEVENNSFDNIIAFGLLSFEKAILAKFDLICW